MIIDDRSISKPPYSGPNNTPLPTAKLTYTELLERITRAFEILDKAQDKT